MAKQRGRYFWQVVDERLANGDSISTVAASVGSTFQEIWQHYRSNPRLPRMYRLLIWLDREDDNVAKRRLESYWSKIRKTYTSGEGYSKEKPHTLALRWGVKPSLIIKMLKWDGLLERLMSKHTKRALAVGGGIGAAYGGVLGAIKAKARATSSRRKAAKKDYAKSALKGAAIGTVVGAGGGALFNKAAREQAYSYAHLKKVRRAAHRKTMEKLKNLDARTSKARTDIKDFKNFLSKVKPHLN